MIGADRKAGRAGLAQIGGEGIVDMVAAFGRLDDGEGDIVGGNTPPVDLALMMGDVDAPDRILVAVRRECPEIEKAARRDEARQDQAGRAPEDNPVLQKQRLPAYPRSFSSRPFSRDQSRCFSVSRLSCSFLPRPTASSSLARP